MWRYEKRLQYPVKISQTNPKLAQYIISQYGGPDGESGAAMRYLSQRYAMPYEKGKAIMTDIGREAPEMCLPFKQKNTGLRSLFPRITSAGSLCFFQPCSST